MEVNDLIQTMKWAPFECNVKVQQKECEAREFHRNSKDSVRSAAGKSVKGRTRI